MLICYKCKAAVQPSSSIKSHFRHKHQLKGEVLRDIKDCYSRIDLADPKCTAELDAEDAKQLRRGDLKEDIDWDSSWVKRRDEAGSKMKMAPNKLERSSITSSHNHSYNNQDSKDRANDNAGDKGIYSQKDNNTLNQAIFLFIVASIKTQLFFLEAAFKDQP
ncbi:hypothetical protein K456DRAFT_44146 [Colletotrichum gloeosporioides 23]|nr:hypothetical protein K456DRAFT_44146 [Colletotrichum gloeosporioides 23]